MAEKIELAETVMLIDAAFLNFVITDMKNNFERMLGRTLQEVDVSLLMTYLALDASLIHGENEIQVLWVYDEQSSKLSFCQPSVLKEELNGVAFMNLFGEFSFVSVSSEGMVSREELFLDLLNIVVDSTDVKKIIVISFNEEYGDKVQQAMNKVADKEMIQFRMNEPATVVDYRWEMLAYPLMQALGIKGEELQ
ncbi:DUF6621 family protein [uncultured Bacteroides sp.]|uniref:DUF6621 family protein n=1 Tax=uncultured Bacteroides sp. TaxID=162156 RepID=UPI002AA63583|nr:DUF6621 family protein [uncultured Bacteroides sp.]